MEFLAAFGGFDCGYGLSSLISILEPVCSYKTSPTPIKLFSKGMGPICRCTHPYGMLATSV